LNSRIPTSVALALAAILMIQPTTAKADIDGPTGGGPASPGVAIVPKLLLSGSTVMGSYSDVSTSQLSGTETRRDQIKLTGSDSRLAFSLKSFYGLEINYRSLAPKDVAYWSKRDELTVISSLYFPSIQWLQPALGYFQISQSGTPTDPLAPPAFITKNTGILVGLRTRFNFWNFGGHGFIAHGRIDYLTSLEAKSNFGKEFTYGLGYYGKIEEVAFTLIGGLTRNTFNASRSDPLDTDGNNGVDGSQAKLTVKHTYDALKLGIEISY
jgi:hypothetical protein